MDGKSQYAQAVYLAQLQACKGSCKCNPCKLLRQAADAMTEETLNPTPANPMGVEDAMSILTAAGYDVAGLSREGQER